MDQLDGRGGPRLERGGGVEEDDGGGNRGQVIKRKRRRKLTPKKHCSYFNIAVYTIVSLCQKMNAHCKQ